MLRVVIGTLADVELWIQAMFSKLDCFWHWHWLCHSDWDSPCHLPSKLIRWYYSTTVDFNSWPGSGFQVSVSTRHSFLSKETLYLLYNHSCALLLLACSQPWLTMADSRNQTCKASSDPSSSGNFKLDLVDSTSEKNLSTDNLSWFSLTCGRSIITINTIFPRLR